MVTNQLCASTLSFGTAVNELLVAVLDQSADCIKVISAQGNVDYMNRNGQCAMEIDDFSVIAGQAWTTLWPPEAKSKIEQAMEKARAGELSRFEAYCPTAKGSPRWWEVIVSPLCHADSEEKGFVATSRDVTELRLLQTKLVHLSRVSAMGVIASTLAHELNQPLTAIVNYASGVEVLVERGATSLELAKPIAEMGMSAARAGKIIRRLRETTQKSEITKQPFKTENIIKEAAIVACAGGCEGINLKFSLRDGAAVLCDPIQIQQVLINLITNACEASAGGGEQDIRIATELSHDNARVSVEDNGPGISPNDLPLLFDAFFSTKSERMGMGLSISRTIIEAHGGRIWAENRPEGGARFSFTLPLAKTS